MAKLLAPVFGPADETYPSLPRFLGHHKNVTAEQFWVKEEALRKRAREDKIEADIKD